MLTSVPHSLQNLEFGGSSVPHDPHDSPAAVSAPTAVIHVSIARPPSSAALQPASSFLTSIRGWGANGPPENHSRLTLNHLGRNVTHVQTEVCGTAGIW